MYFALSIGMTLSLKRPQIGQATEPYSMTVTGALASPSVLSAGLGMAGAATANGAAKARPTRARHRPDRERRRRRISALLQQRLDGRVEIADVALVHLHLLAV